MAHLTDQYQDAILHQYQDTILGVHRAGKHQHDPGGHEEGCEEVCVCDVPGLRQLQGLHLRAGLCAGAYVSGTPGG